MDQTKEQTCKTDIRKLQAEIDYQVLGRRLRKIRKKLGLTQAQLSEQMNLGTNYYGQYETGKCRINFSRFIQFICITKSSADELLRGCHKDYPTCVSLITDYSEKRRELNALLDKYDDQMISKIIEVIQIMQR